MVILILTSGCTKKLERNNLFDPNGTNPAGIVSGTVTKSSDKSPVKDVNITVKQFDIIKGSATTDTTGKYSITILMKEINEYQNIDIEASLTGYQTSKVSKSISAGQTTTADFVVDVVIPTTTTNNILNGSYGEGINYTLLAKNSPYSVTGNVTFTDAGGNTLTIEPGVIIKFNPSSPTSTFLVNCPVTANGTSSNQIKLTSGSGQTVVKFGKIIGTATTILNYVTLVTSGIELSDGISGIEIYGNSTSKITNCTFLKTTYLATNGEIKNCNFKNLTNAGGGAPRISYCNISGSFYSNSNPPQNINYCNFTSPRAGIFGIGGGSTIDATNNWWGTTDSNTIKSYIADYTPPKVTYSPYATSLISTAGPQ